MVNPLLPWATRLICNPWGKNINTTWQILDNDRLLEYSLWNHSSSLTPRTTGSWSTAAQKKGTHLQLPKRTITKQKDTIRLPKYRKKNVIKPPPKKRETKVCQEKGTLEPFLDRLQTRHPPCLGFSADVVVAFSCFVWFSKVSSFHGPVFVLAITLKDSLIGRFLDWTRLQKTGKRCNTPLNGANGASPKRRRHAPPVVCTEGKSYMSWCPTSPWRSGDIRGGTWEVKRRGLLGQKRPIWYLFGGFLSTLR